MSLSVFSLEGKVAIITGAGRGVGRGIALEFAKVGADVVLAARTAADLDAVAAEVRALGRKALPVPTDVQLSDQVNNLVQKTMKEFGRIDILVNNAGGSTFRPLLEVSERGWDALNRENLKQVFLCGNAVAKIMVEQKKGGCIINIASVAALKGSSGTGPYSAAKAGVVNLTQTQAVEWAPYNIRVNCILPGTMDTPGLRIGIPSAEERAARAKQILLRRLGQPEDIARACIYFASNASDWVTGAILAVDGGGSISPPR